MSVVKRRPSKARHEDRVRFWEAIADGVPSEDAAGEAMVHAWILGPNRQLDQWFVSGL